MYVNLFELFHQKFKAQEIKKITCVIVNSDDDNNNKSIIQILKVIFLST